MQRRWLIACVVACSSCVRQRASAARTATCTGAAGRTIRRSRSAACRAWYIIGDGSTRPRADETMTVTVDAPAGTRVVDACVGELPPVRLGATAERRLRRHAVDARRAAGRAAESCSPPTAADARSPARHSIAAARTTCWSRPTRTSRIPATTRLGVIDTLHARPSRIVITHFWAPYTYTDPAVTDERQASLATWMRAERDTSRRRDRPAHPSVLQLRQRRRVDLHHRSVRRSTRPATPAATRSSSTPTSRDQLGVLLQHAADLFAQRGLGTPTTFRAGGWTATIDTMLALARQRLHRGLERAQLGADRGRGRVSATACSTLEHGALGADRRHEPAVLTELDVRRAGRHRADTAAPRGAGQRRDDRLRVADKTLDRIFDENWDGSAARGADDADDGLPPVDDAVTARVRERVDGFLTYADGHLATSDLGPVVYTTLSDVTICIFCAVVIDSVRLRLTQERMSDFQTEMNRVVDEFRGADHRARPARRDRHARERARRWWRRYARVGRRRPRARCEAHAPTSSRSSGTSSTRSC